MADNMRLTLDINKRATERAKAEASEINPKSGTSTRFYQYFVIEGREAIRRLQEEAEPKITANNERFVKKVADVENAPIKAELNDKIKVIKDYVRNKVNSGIDARIQRINASRSIPVRTDSLKLLQTIQMLVDMGADISETDWKMWTEKFAGHYLEEKVFAGLAKKKGIDILPASNPERSIENLETFRDMANHTIERLDNPDGSLYALSFVSLTNKGLNELMEQIDSDLASIIPADKLTVLQRLKDAKEHAYNKDNVELSVKIGSFINRNIDKLATPEEMQESLYAEAEEFIQKGMAAEKGSK